MQILKTKMSKQCKNGTIKTEYLLEGPVTMNILDYFRNFGNVSLIKNLEPPFYTFEKPGRFTIKGLLDDRKVYVLYGKEHHEISKKYVSVLFDSYDPEIPAIEKVVALEGKI